MGLQTFIVRETQKLLHNSSRAGHLNVTVSSHVTFYQINKCFKYIIFSLLTNFLRPLTCCKLLYTEFRNAITIVTHAYRHRVGNYELNHHLLLRSCFFAVQCLASFTEFLRTTDTVLPERWNKILLKSRVASSWYFRRGEKWLQLIAVSKSKFISVSFGGNCQVVPGSGLLNTCRFLMSAKSAKKRTTLSVAKSSQLLVYLKLPENCLKQKNKAQACSWPLTSLPVQKYIQAFCGFSGGRLLKASVLTLCHGMWFSFAPQESVFAVFAHLSDKHPDVNSCCFLKTLFEKNLVLKKKRCSRFEVNSSSQWKSLKEKLRTKRINAGFAIFYTLSEERKA